MMLKQSINIFLVFIMSLGSIVHAKKVPLPYIGKPTQLPIEVALDFLREDLEHGEYRILRIAQHSQSESSNTAVNISVIMEGLLDDSLAKARFRLQLYNNTQQRWQIDKISKDFACWSGRGHVDWSSQSCH